MDLRAHALETADPEAVEFVRFCRGRRRVGWPELYDEMWAVASRSLFRGYGCAELEERGIWFSLFGTPHLAAMAAAVIEEERASGVPGQGVRERRRAPAAATR
ncbi:MAG: hypothetical protein ABIG85_01060 [Chloroflexota bacterium]